MVVAVDDAVEVTVVVGLDVTVVVAVLVAVDVGDEVPGVD